MCVRVDLNGGKPALTTATSETASHHVIVLAVGMKTAMLSSVSVVTLLQYVKNNIIIVKKISEK